VPRAGKSPYSVGLGGVGFRNGFMNVTANLPV
jgi:hypothetical protein